ncbi:MAG: hypothetical protein ABUL77_02630 [Bacteroidota bacterium]
MINSMLIAGTLLLNFVVGPSVSTAPATPAPAGAATAASLAVTDSFAPPPRPKRRRPTPARPAAQEPPADEVDQDPPPPRRPAGAPARRRATPVDESTEDTAADEEDEEEEKPRVKRSKRRRAVEEETEEDEDEDDEDEDDAPIASLPSVAPRMLSFQLSPMSFVGRNFAFTLPAPAALQKENTFPRVGIVAALEAYPLVRMAHGWFRKVGIGAAISADVGTAAMKVAGGAMVSYPVSQQRWSIDLRYAFTVGQRLVVIPALGLGSTSYDLKREGTGVAPSACDTSATVIMPCLTDISAKYIPLDLHLRIAVTDSVAVGLSGGYFLGSGAPQGNWKADQRVGKTSGYHGELGVNSMLNDWLAVRGALSYVHYDYAFSAGTGAYTAASETYYSVNFGAIVFTR